MSRRPRALVAAYYFPPQGGGGVGRTLKVVRALDAAGWDVAVLTVDDAAWTRDPEALRSVPARVRVVRVANPDWGRIARRVRGPARPGSAAGVGPGRLARWLVPDLHVGWSLLATPFAAALAATRAVDVVYTTGPPYSTHLLGRVAGALGTPWIADCRDGWTGDHSRLWVGPRRRAIERRLEESMLRRADRVFFASDAVREECLEWVGDLAQRSETVLTGFDPEEFPSPRPAARGPHFEIVHAGTFGLNRTALLPELLGALRTWADRDPSVPARVRVRLVGAEPGVGVQLAAAGVADWVGSEPPVSRTRLAHTLSRAHAALVLGADGPRGGQPVPGKLFDAVGAGRFVLALSRPGAFTQLVRRRRLGLAADPHDPEAVVAAFAVLYACWRRGDPMPAPAPAARASLVAPRTLAPVVNAFEALRAPGRIACPSPSVS